MQREALKGLCVTPQQQTDGVEAQNGASAPPSCIKQSPSSWPVAVVTGWD